MLHNSQAGAVRSCEAFDFGQLVWRFTVPHIVLPLVVFRYLVLHPFRHMEFTLHLHYSVPSCWQLCDERIWKGLELDRPGRLLNPFFFFSQNGLHMSWAREHCTV